MRRRRFLEATLVGAGGLLLGAGCGSSDSTDGTDATSSGGGDAAGSGPDAGGTTGPAVVDGSSFFPQSVVSGDPKPDGVILWTRVVDAEATAAIAVRLQVSTDEEFTDLVELSGAAAADLTAEASHDYCVKARVVGLSAGTTYYYRFLYERDGKQNASRTGRAKTAPAPDADATVRFAYASCQDYGSRFYNSWARMVSEEVDFIVFLGDYVYETTGNPLFQDTSGRSVVFEDTSGAVVFDEGTEDESYAAATLEQYRTLYRTYRADPDLQAVHERHPFIAIWDDHEFSNDCYGAYGTYFDDKTDEHDVERRQNANEAWFDYMPVDYTAGPDFAYDRSAGFPGDLQIYRDLVFGKNLHLVMTDLRTWRVDHPIAEGAYPGAILLGEAEILEAMGEIPATAPARVPLADIDASYGELLRARAEAEGHDPAVVGDATTLDWINVEVGRWNTENPDDTRDLLDPEAFTAYQRAYAYLDLGKSTFFSSLGSRALVNDALYAAWTRLRYEQSGGESEVIMGTTQRTWFLDTLQGSTSTWKVWGNEFPLMPLRVDLRGIDILPPAFQRLFALNLDDWSAAPNRRSEILDALAALENVVAITGDIHSFYAGTPMSLKGERIPEFIVGAISSSSFKDILKRIASSDPNLAAAGAPLLAQGVRSFLLDRGKATNPHMADAIVDEHGFSICEVSAGELAVTYYRIPEKHVSERVADAELDGVFTIDRYKVLAGAKDVWKEIDGAWQRWDHTTLEWSSS